MCPAIVRRWFTRFIAGLACTAGIAVAGVAGAEEQPGGRTPPRLSLMEGEVSFWRSGTPDWEAAELNLPLAPGDFLYTGPSSRAELQVGARAFLRLAADTQLGIEAHEGNSLRVEITRGRASLDARDLAPGARIDLATPHGKLSVSSPGFYDVRTGSDSTSFVALQGGHGTVFTRDDSLDLRAGSEVVARPDMALARYDAPAADEWDQWNSQRTDRILASLSRGTVSDDVYGIHDLDDHGSWSDEPRYGRIWVPRSVPVDWAPYTTGRWIWDPGYGWSWVDTAPWGWAPYHYGRWVYLNSYWAWAPGPVVVAPFYSPALVGFFGGGGISVGVSIGYPFVSWVALGWGEPLLPWWGPTWFRGQPCWNGWGGPTIINNVYVDKRRVHGRDVGHFEHQDRPRAVSSVRHRDFANRTAQRVSLSADDRRHLKPVRTGLPVDPSDAGVRPSRASSRTRPPQRNHPEVARTSDSPQMRSRGDMRAPDRARFGDPSQSDPGSPNRQTRMRPDRPVPERPPPVRPLRERPQAGMQRSERPSADAFGDRGTRVRAANRPPGRSGRPEPPAPPRRALDQSASRAVDRDSWSGGRPRSEPPQRPLRAQPQAPAVTGDAYGAPQRDAFTERRRQVPQAPQREVRAAPVERPQAPSAPEVNVPSVRGPAVRGPAPDTAPQQRSGGDFSAPVRERPSASSAQAPQRSERGSFGGGASSRGDARPRSAPQSRPHRTSN